MPVEDVPVVVRDISGDKLVGSSACSCLAPGIGMGSDISNIVRLCALEEDTPKDTFRSKLPPRRTKPSAMIVLNDVLLTRKKWQERCKVYMNERHGLLTEAWVRGGLNRGAAACSCDQKGICTQTNLAVTRPHMSRITQSDKRRKGWKTVLKMLSRSGVLRILEW